MKKTLLITSLGVIALLAYLTLIDSEWTEYARHQQAYKDVLDTNGDQVDYPIEIRQIVLPELGRIDRCVSCHVAMEDPRMAGAKNPLKTHPGTFLDVHDVQKVGCTLCHDGQGRATTKRDAHANMFAHWEKKRVSGDSVQANCTRCHSEDSRVMMPALARGRDLFRTRGCLGCHKLKGKGGSLGPDLTEMAEASTHLKMPVDANRHDLLERFWGNVNQAYIYEAITEPKAQPTDSKMFDADLTEAQAADLTVYIRSFASSAVPDQLQHRTGTTHVPDGKELFGTYCASCHGADGMGTNKKELAQIAPAVAHESFLAIADPEFVYYKTYHSGNAAMPAWGKAGGFTGEEVSKVSDYLFSLKKAPPKLASVNRKEGSRKFGRILFDTKCSGCHGVDGAHETDLVGPTLDSPEFRSYADRDFMYSTIANGRSQTAMPSWHFLPKQDFADMLEFLDVNKNGLPRFEKISKTAKADLAVKWGKARFHKLCASCHGSEAEGNIGPSLNSPEFQMLASDRLIYDTIVLGREGTAMGRWPHLSADDVGWLLAYIRSTGEPKTEQLFEPGEILGSESKGRETFEGTCASCHGSAGVGHIAPAIGNKSFLAAVSDHFIKETAAVGRSGTGMQGNLKGQGGTASLPERQINDVVAYLRSLQDTTRTLAGVTQGDISLGRDRFARICAQCHGPAGSGGKGPGIGRKGFLSQANDGFLLGTIANGRTGTEMKGFTQGAGGLAELSEHDIRSIVVYLRSGADTSKIKRQIVDGTPSNGKKLYAEQCSQCHGTWERQSYAPHLTNKVFMEAASDVYLQATMALGRHGTAMRPMMRSGGGVVGMTSKEVNDIVSYLRQSANELTDKGRK